MSPRRGIEGEWVWSLRSIRAGTASWTLDRVTASSPLPLRRGRIEGAIVTIAIDALSEIVVSGITLLGLGLGAILIAALCGDRDDEE